MTGRPPLTALPNVVAMLDPLPDGDGPLTERIAARIREAIEAGRLRQGERVPPARLIGRRYKVHKDTACRAMALLEQEGLLLRVARVGVFVRGNGVGGT